MSDPNGFDPDAYAGAGAAPADAFDPLAYAGRPTPPTVSRLDAIKLGAGNSAAFGFGSEVGGALKALPGVKVPSEVVTPGPRALAKAYPGVPYPEAASRWFNDNRPDLASAQQAEQLRVEQRGRYLPLRNEIRAKQDAAWNQYPKEYGAGFVAGLVPSVGGALANATANAAGQVAVPLGKQMLAGGSSAAPLAAAMAAHKSDAESLGGIGLDALVGGAAGFGLGALTPAAVTAVRNIPAAGRWVTSRVGQLFTPKVTPTESANRLAAQGIPLTTGQMDPNSFVSTVEQTALKGPVNVDSARHEAETAARALVLRQAMEPGAQLPPGTIPEQLAGIQAGFEAQYAPISSTQVNPVNVATMPQRLTTGRGHIPDSVRAAAASEVQDALTVLPSRIADALPENRVPKVIGYSQPGTGAQVALDPYAVETPPVTEPVTIPDSYRGVSRSSIAQPTELPNQGLIGGAPRLEPGTTTPAAGTGWKPVIADPPPMPEVNAGDLQAVRSIIRTQLRKSVNDPKMSAALAAAEDEITRTLSGELPPGKAQALQEIDGRYAILKLLEDASARSGLQGNFTWPQLGAAIKANEGKLSFGANGGLLRQLATDAEVTFRPNIPQTGVMGRIVANAPGMSYAVGPLSRAAQWPSVRAAMLRQPIPWTPAVPSGAVPNPASGPVELSPSLAEVMRLFGRPALYPAGADQESAR